MSKFGTILLVVFCHLFMTLYLGLLVDEVFLWFGLIDFGMKVAAHIIAYYVRVRPYKKTCPKEHQNKWHSQWNGRKAREQLFQGMARTWIDQYKKISLILGEKETTEGLAEYIGEQMSHTVVLRPKYIKQINGERK